jgi:hypothetical protein
LGGGNFPSKAGIATMTDRPGNIIELLEGITVTFSADHRELKRPPTRVLADLFLESPTIVFLDDCLARPAKSEPSYYEHCWDCGPSDQLHVESEARAV